MIYIQQLFFNGSNVVYPSSIRFDNYYQNGTVIRPDDNQLTPLIVYDGES